MSRENDSQETDERQGDHTGELPRVDFSTFVLSLGTTALYQMGIVPDPATGESIAAEPLLAQQTIDTLEMLRRKTLNNLDDEERKLIDSLLYELRIKFVEISR
jgi:hypothetical protein